MNFVALLITLTFLPMVAKAQEVTDFPHQTKAPQEQSLALHIMPDESKLLHLDQDAASVVVGNPNHINVVLDTPRTLIVVPRAQGTSHFSVIGRNGDILIEKQVIVGAPQAVKTRDDKKYVRIRRSCANSSAENCQPSTVYYCDGPCHEIVQNSGTNPSSGGSAPSLPAVP